MGSASCHVRRPEFTTEWPFAVKWQKATPVFDAVGNDLKKNLDVDLKAELGAQGHSYGEIRTKSLDETVALFAGFVRSRSEASAQDGSITPHVIVPVDNYYEKGGKIDGSDASLIRSAAALYTPQKIIVVQVDTGGGKETVGRLPLFKIEADQHGHPTLLRHQDGAGKAPVDPHGPNAEFAPTMYVRSAEDMGKIFSAAYRNQSPLSDEELSSARQRG